MTEKEKQSLHFLSCMLEQIGRIIIKGAPNMHPVNKKSELKILQANANEVKKSLGLFKG